MSVSGRNVKGLLDTGCSRTIARSSLAKKWIGKSCVKAFDGYATQCKGFAWMDICVNGVSAKTKVIGAEKLIDGVDIVIGVDVLRQVGAVNFSGGSICMRDMPDNNVVSGPSKACVSIETIELDDKDFSGKFSDGVWTVRWKWKDGVEPKLTNMVADYNKTLSDEAREAYEAEIHRWIDEGILVEWKNKVDGVLPLMAVLQPSKHKVRPVLDFRGLNNFVQSHTGGEDISVCSSKLREWRRTNGELEIVDLQAAYLQIRVSEELWKHQLVNFNGKVFALTRLGFGLNVAPKIMTVVLKHVLAQNEAVREGTNPYVDDILVNVSKIPASEVAEHLEKYGLRSKPPEKLDGGAALGLQLSRKEGGMLFFSRGNHIPEIPAHISRRQLFSICGKIVGHYPVAGWLRVACSFVKRASAGASWDDDVGERARSMLAEMKDKICLEDPVQGAWTVPDLKTGVVWCDASSIASGVALEIGGVMVEDRAWLRKGDDYHHINVAELDSVVKGLNLAVDWGLEDIIIRTDSATVRSWCNLALTEEHPVRSKGAAEVLVKRRLGIFKSIVQELNLKVSIELVPSSKNIADTLTRVPKAWLVEEANSCSVGLVEDIHGRHHMGVERTLFLAKQLDPEVSREEVQRMVKNCRQCQSVDPPPSRHTEGNLHVSLNWSRLAVDVTHFRGVPYLSVVDCGPGRFAIWRELKRETSRSVYKELQQIFRERGPVDEVLMDNALSFKSAELMQLFKSWNINPYYRAAYRPSGNSIVERNHRTIKSWAEKSGVDPEEAVFWYNVSPKTAQKQETVPYRAVHSYKWRLPMEDPLVYERGASDSIKVGDQVWVKPQNCRCTTRWSIGEITGINSQNNVLVNGTPRHILDVRRVTSDSEEDFEDCRESVTSGEEGAPTVREEPLPPRRSSRVRRPPSYLVDYDTSA